VSRSPAEPSRHPARPPDIAAQAPSVPPAVVRIWPARVAVALGALLPAAAVAVWLDGGPWVLAALALWEAVALARTAGTRRVVAAREQLASDLRIAGLFGGGIALAAVVDLLPLPTARTGLVVVAVATVSMALVRRVQPRTLSGRRVVLVGSHREVEEYFTVGMGPDVVAGALLTDGDATAPPVLPVPSTDRLSSLTRLVSEVHADAILVLPGVDVDAQVVRDLTWLFEASPVTVGVVCPVSSVSAHRLRTTVTTGSTVLELSAPRATAGARFTKALVDRVGAGLLLVVSSPLLAVLWVLVRLDSPGPGFLLQDRVGRDGRPFRMATLRTMRHGAGSLLETLAAEEDPAAVPFTIRRDPRVTRVGYWLRRSSLDELPQLVNVLRGEMSLVGPRPASPDEVAEYDAVARRRLVVKPGLTGLWQVSGRGDLLWDESLQLDLYYADNWRLLDDLSIAARTVASVAQARGAY